MVEPVFTEDSPKIKEIKHQARRKSIKEGIFATIQTSFGEYYISPFAIAINASEALIALITSITGLLGPISQIFSSNLLKRYSRKKIVRKSVLLQAILWLPLILISFLFIEEQ
jgi:MFS family permease